MKTCGIQSAEYPTMEGCSIPVEASSVSGWESPVDRAAPVAIHVLGDNWIAPIEQVTRKLN